MIHQANLLVILAMALVTYFTRLGGYFLLRNKNFSPKVKEMMEIIPGCVLISVIAPAFSSWNIPDVIGLFLTIIAASRLSLLPTIIIGVGSVGFLRLFFA